MTENQRLESEVSSLAQIIADRDRALNTQVVTVPKLTPTQLGQQWGAAADEPAPPVDAYGNFQVPSALAQKSDIALLTVPVLQKDKADLQNQVTAQQDIISNDAEALASERQSGLQAESACVADKKALTLQIDKVKKDSLRGKIKAFVYGYAAGFASAIAVILR